MFYGKVRMFRGEQHRVTNVCQVSLLLAGHDVTADREGGGPVRSKSPNTKESGTVRFLAS